MTGFFFPCLSPVENMERSLFIPQDHLKSKLCLENVFWFSRLLTKTHLLDFTGWNLRNGNSSNLVTCFLEVTTKRTEGTKGTPVI